MTQARSAPALAGWYVISLRPSGGHAPVRRAAAALGAHVLPLSTLRLAALDAGIALAAALACDDVVFTSPAAVRFAARQAPLRPRAGQRWLAVGAGTAAALRRSGVPGALAPIGRADSESLLALPALTQVEGRDIGLVTAPGGRGVIAETLAHRGARVHLASVYRREASPPRSDRLRAAIEAPAQCALLVSSAEAFDVLWSSLPAAGRERLRARPVVASSPRLAVMLAAQGFETIVTAASAIPTRMLAALAADVAQGRFR
jgi:uroporphyrinogen-III synthase